MGRRLGDWNLFLIFSCSGPTEVIIILILFIVEMAPNLRDIAVRAMVIARVHYCSFWIIRALLDTALQGCSVAHLLGSGKGKRRHWQVKNPIKARAPPHGKSSRSGHGWQPGCAYCATRCTRSVAAHGTFRWRCIDGITSGEGEEAVLRLQQGRTFFTKCRHDGQEDEAPERQLSPRSGECTVKMTT